MKYIEMTEMTIEEAMKRCEKNTKVFVATQDLTKDNVDIVFVSKRKNEYSGIFEDVKTVASLCDDFVKQLRLFTEKQDVRNIKPCGFQKIVLLRKE